MVERYIPQLEASMRTRVGELGIEAGSRLDRVVSERNIARAINPDIKRGRTLGMSL